MRRPSCAGSKFCFKTKIGPRMESSFRARSSGACAEKNVRCSFEKSLRMESSPSATSRTDADGVQIEVGCVEEVDLADLGLERIEAEACDRGAVVGGGNRELQFDAVRLLRELQHLDELLVGEPLLGHRVSVLTRDYAVDVRLYNSAVSGNCYKVRLLLAHLGIAYETVELSVVDRSNRSEVLGELNPGLRVPTLVLDDGRPLAESNAIIWYFGDGTQYVPDEPYERAQTLQ